MFRTASARAETRRGGWAHEVSEHIQKIPLKKLDYAPGQLALELTLEPLLWEPSQQRRKRCLESLTLLCLPVLRTAPARAETRGAAVWTISRTDCVMSEE